MTRTLLAAALAASCCSACAPSRTPVPVLTPASGPPPMAREFRAVWVATVANIDWPSRPGLPVDTQKAELIAIMDRAVELNLNAVILQVRTAADALYPSEFEPWSEYLTGTQGKAPEPLYDPLAFAVEAAHARGLELHAWFNPYRAKHPSMQSAVAPNHISLTKPELVRRYGTHLWMDPGEPGVQEHSIRVLTDVARRYDVDGIHIDDYFYPYRERDSANVEIPFPDDASYQRYVAAGGKLGRSDWRRNNVDMFVKRLNDAVHEVKPWLRFGVSPIGIWRPGFPADGCCFDAYESIYADARKWLAEGWLDYFVPQLYRSLADPAMNYGIMLGWWGEQNLQQRHVYVGMIPSNVRRTADSTGWPATEIVGQIYVARGHPAATGHVHFSARSLMRNPDSLVQRLQRTVYRAPALPPVATWLPGKAPAAPRLTLAPVGGSGNVAIEIVPGDGSVIRNWAVRVQRGERWSAQLLPGGERRLVLENGGEVREVAVSAVDRNGRESALVTVRPAAAAQ